MPDPARILIIRPTALGDVARSVPVLASLRAAYPQAKIDWLVQTQYSPAIAHHPALSSVVPFDRKAMTPWFPGSSGWKVFWALARELRQRRYDLVVDVQGLARSGLFAWLTRAPVRVGFRSARECAWLGYTQRYQVETRQHSVDRMLGLLAAHGLPVQHDTRLFVPPADQAWWREQSAAAGLDAIPYAVLAPTAQWKCKCWPIERFIALGQKLLASDLGLARIVILAAPHERTAVQPLLEALPADRVLFPSTTVGQMLAVLSRASLVVANDSAAMHMAAGLGRPLVALFGPTDPNLVGPYQRADAVVQPAQGMDTAGGNDPTKYRHLRDDQTLISRISLEMVWEKVLAQLRRQVV